MAQRTCWDLYMRRDEVTLDTTWHNDFAQGPFDHEDDWDPSWIIPLEFEMEGGKIVKSALVYDAEYDCFDYDEKNYDFMADCDVYGIVKWRYSSEHPL